MRSAIAHVCDWPLLCPIVDRCADAAVWQDTSDEPSFIDMETFTQILELDEVDDDGESDYAFSKDMVNAYFEQAVKTFEEMDDALWVAQLVLVTAV